MKPSVNINGITEEQMLEELQRIIQQALKGFINQNNTQEMRISVANQVTRAMETLKAQGVLPTIDLSPDVVEQSPEDPNAIIVTWTDPEKVRVLQAIGIQDQQRSALQ